MGWGVLGDLGSWLSTNKDWLKPVVSTGLGAYQAANENGTRSDYADMLRAAEQRNYDDSKDAYDSYNSWAQQNAAASAGAANARAAAARATEAARQGALKKAMKTEKKYYDTAQGYLAPWRESAARLLPQAEATYSGSLSGMNNLMQMLQSPEAMAKMNASVPAYSVNLGLPDYLRGRK